MNYKHLITIEPDKRSGQPCIRGLRLTVQDILEYLAAGMSNDEILADFPDLTVEDIRDAAIEGAVQRLRPKLMTVCAVLASLVPILWESGIGSDVMKPIAAPIVGGMITSTLHVLILVPVFYVMMKERMLRRGTLHIRDGEQLQ